VGGLGVGEPGADGRPSVLAAKAGQNLEIRVRAAALLAEEPVTEIRKKSLSEKPYWHVERARIDDTQTVPVELIVNGRAVERQELTADGQLQDLKFSHKLRHSAWVAVRILPSSHTNPVFVEVDGKPIRASKRSAQWCLDAVDVCWGKKEPAIRESEKEAAAKAYEVARQTYRQVLAEAVAD